VAAVSVEQVDACQTFTGERFERLDGEVSGARSGLLGELCGPDEVGRVFIEVFRFVGVELVVPAYDNLARQGRPRRTGLAAEDGDLDLPPDHAGFDDHFRSE